MAQLRINSPEGQANFAATLKAELTSCQRIHGTLPLERRVPFIDPNVKRPAMLKRIAVFAVLVLGYAATGIVLSSGNINAAGPTTLADAK